MMFRTLAVAFMLAALATSGAAQDFGVMESAETIQRGNFKLVGYPMLLLGEGGAKNTVGVVVRGGYGFQSSVPSGDLAKPLCPGPYTLLAAWNTGPDLVQLEGCMGSAVGRFRRS